MTIINDLRIFLGTNIRKWKSDHEHTVVWVQENRLHAPRDNGDRPEIKVPASNWLEFKLVK